MRRRSHRRRKARGKAPFFLAAAVFLCVLICPMILSARHILFLTAAALAALGIFLLRL